MDLRKSFATDWLKIGQNCKHGDTVKFLDAGHNEGTEAEPKWVLTVMILRNGAMLEQKKFQLNKTNYNETAKVYGYDTESWVNKEMRINKVKARNPKTNSPVDSIILTAPNISENGEVIIE